MKNNKQSASTTTTARSTQDVVLSSDSKDDLVIPTYQRKIAAADGVALVRMGLNDLPKYDKVAETGRYLRSVKLFTEKFDKLAALKGWGDDEKIKVLPTLLEGHEKSMYKEWLEQQEENHEEPEYPAAIKFLADQENDGCREETEDRSVHVQATKTPHARIHHEAGWLFCRDGHR